MSIHPANPKPSDGVLSGAVAIVLAATLWGFDGVVLTPRLSGLPIILVVFLLHAIPFLIMQVAFRGMYSRLRQMEARGFAALLAASICGGLLGTYAIVKALFAVNFNGLSIVVLLQKLQPVFAIVLASIVLRERIRSRFLVRAVAATVGAYLLAFGRSLPQLGGGEDDIVLGAMWAVVAAASFGSATAFGKLLLEFVDFRAATFARYGLTAVLAGLILVATGNFDFGAVTHFQWGIVLLIGLTTGSGALFLYYYGLSRVRATTAAICELWLPLSAVFFDGWLHGTRLAPMQWCGGLLLVSAITLVSLDAARSPEGDH